MPRHPDIENTDIVIEYVVNETDQTAWLVSVELLNSNAVTYRGLKIGDEERLFFSKYGESYEPRFNNETSHYFQLELWAGFTSENENDYPLKTISIVVDKTSGSIISILFDYRKIESMLLFDLPTMSY